MALPRQISGYPTQIGPIESHTVQIAELNLDSRFYLSSNAKLSAVSALPFAYDGMAFAWNKTMLQALGYSTEADADDLPVAFNTWEEIFALSNTWSPNRPTYKGSPINIVFPMSVGEPWSGYSSVTAAGWSIFATGQATQPGFDDPAFLHGLEFIKAAHDAKISVEADGTTTPGLTAGWRWDPVLNAQSAPFGLVGTWMDIIGATTKGKYDLQISPMPTWQGNRLRPFVKVKVFVVNKSSPYPSAAAELLRLLYTTSGMQAMVDNSTYVPSLRSGATIAPDYSAAPVTQQLGKAFLQGNPEPVMLTFPNNPGKSGIDVYTNIGLNLFYQDVWDGVKTPAQAQMEIVAAAEQYILTNNQ
ncbi:MAG: extracellular solute-binding protein [Spirochaetales bacterium]